MARETIKTCDLCGQDAAYLFARLNEKLVRLDRDCRGLLHLVTDVDPGCLIYPEGWYIQQGTFRNKGNSSTGLYSEIPVRRSDGSSLGLL